MNKEKTIFTFIDLFAGIGGFRIACEQENGRCIFSSEINSYACETYKANFNETPSGDISKIDSYNIPDFDLLCAGFPCQPFSIAGKRLGFDDIRGTLIYEILRILRDKKPRSFLLENVPGLLSHDNGRTFYIIRKLLGKTFNGRNEFFLRSDNLEYNIFYKVLNSADFGLAQNRKRIFIVGFRKDISRWQKFRFPIFTDKSKVIKDILETNIDKKYLLDIIDIQKLSNKKNRASLKDRSTLLNNKSNTIISSFGSFGSFGSIYINIKNKCNTILPEFAYKRKETYNILSHQLIDLDSRIRIFTPRECARLQGFPEDFRIHKNDKQAYKQFGNAVSPPVIREIVKEIKKIIIKEKRCR